MLGLTLSEDKLSAVLIDSKWLGETRNAQGRMVVLLVAFDHQTGGVFAQPRVPAGTNEAKAVLELLERLILKGRIVTADAAFCSPDICEAIVFQEDHYVLAVKDKQPALIQVISCEFTAVDAAFSLVTRRERRMGRQRAETIAKRTRAHQTTHIGEHRIAQSVRGQTRLV